MIGRAFRNNFDMPDNALLIEPWRLMDMASAPRSTRAAAARAFPRVSHRTAAPFGLEPISLAEDVEIVVQYMLWMVAAVLPLIVALWLCARPSLSAASAAAAVALSMIWPHREWPVPPASRLTMPIRNCKAARAFIRYFPMRVLLEDDALLDAERPMLFAGAQHPFAHPQRHLPSCRNRLLPLCCAAVESHRRGPTGPPTRRVTGVPHGLFPIGFALLGLCNFALPWRRIRGAAASVT
jgi:hypothetical protein